jgi:hypothetical protein
MMSSVIVLTEMLAWVITAVIAQQVAKRGIRLWQNGRELIGRCPICGGTDWFSINTSNRLWIAAAASNHERNEAAPAMNRGRDPTTSTGSAPNAARKHEGKHSCSMTLYATAVWSARPATSR